MNWKAKEFWVDGGCHNNGKDNPRAYGSVSDGTKILRREWPHLRTNNEAEYQTLLQCLIYLQSGGAAIIYTDSGLVIGQLTKGWKVKAVGLVGLVGGCKQELARTGATLYWVHRDVMVERLGH